MNLSSLNNTLLYSKITGVNIHWQSEDVASISVVQLINKKGQLHIADSKEFLSFDQLISFLDIKQPICLSISGNQIIHKYQPDSGTGEDELHLNNLFPNFSSSDFYIQKAQISSQNVFFSVVRKDYLNKIIDSFKEKGLFIVNITLGPFGINCVRHLMQSHTSVYTSNLVLTYEDDFIRTINSNTDGIEKLYYLEDEKISSKHLLTYANTIGFYINNQDISTTIPIDTLKDDYKYKSYVKIMGAGALVFLFSILLINFIVFRSYSTSKEAVEMEYEAKKLQINDLDKLQTEVKSKSDFLQKNKFLQLSRTSFYVDRIAFCRPNGVAFISLTVFPINREIASNQPDMVSFKENNIIISGSANNVSNLNDWLDKLRKEEWVKELSLTKIKQTESPQLTMFTVELVIK